MQIRSSEHTFYRLVLDPPVSHKVSTPHAINGLAVDQLKGIETYCAASQTLPPVRESIRWMIRAANL